jgi:signal peptidase I
MNKNLKYTLISIGAVLILFQVAKMTHLLTWYKSPSAGNYPTLKTKESFIVSRIVSPQRFSMICFKWNDSLQGKHTRVYRLCGVEGDKVEIRNGDLFVNGIYADSNFSLAHNYLLKAADLEKIKAFEEIGEDQLSYLSSSDSLTLYITDTTVTNQSLPAQRVVLSKTYPDPLISQRFSADWNQDNFGPIIVPKASYFVLGDNRHGAEDSRYLGFIPKSNLVATVIGK